MREQSALVVVLCLAALPLAAAEPQAAAPGVQTGTPRRLLVGDYSTKRIAIVGRQGELEWEHPIQEIHDAWVLPSGNVLFQTNWRTLVEVSPAGHEVWKYDAGKANGNDGKRVEIHAFQPLENGAVMIAESGPARIIEVDRDGKLRKEIKLKVEHPNPHTDTRLARKTAAGTYLVCHEADKVVREYDAAGQIVWTYDVGSKVYGCQRLANGNTLLGCGDGHRAIEVDPAGKIVWSVTEKELPGITLAWVTMVQRLPNGNTVLVNCHAGPQNPQIVEVAPDKKVVWTFRDFRRFGNSLPVGKVLD